MSRLSELRAEFDAMNAAAMDFVMNGGDRAAYERAWLHLAGELIKEAPALLAVAEAARGLVLGDPIGQTLPAALAPLLKEVPDAS